jgi:hypothetical protein
MSRTAALVGAGLVLALGGGALLWWGVAAGPSELTVAGILVAIAGLVCLRIGYWRVRVRAMTQAGLALHDDGAEPPRPDPDG